MLIAARVHLDGLPCVVPPAGRLSQRAQRANSYWCPLGATPGRARVLLLGKHLETIATLASHQLEFVVEGDDKTTTAAFPELILLRSQRLAAGAAGDGDALHLVELADKRWLVDRYSDTGNLQFNVRAAAHGEPYLAGTEGHDWTSVLAALWNTMSGVLGSFPGAPASATLSGSPENLRFIGVNAWRALHAVCDVLGLAVAYDPLTATFSLVRLGDEQTALAAVLSENRFRQNVDFRSSGKGIPAIVRVYFATHFRNFGQERDTERDANWSVVAATHSIDVPTNEPAAQAGSVAPLWDTLPRVLGENNEPTNDAALQARAEERAAAWLRARQRRSLNLVLPGIDIRVVPGGEIHTVVWKAAGPRSGTTTELISWTSSRANETGRGGRDSTAGENFLPPDLARRTAPNFPRLLNLVRVDDGGSELGEVLTANEAGLFSGYVMRYVAGEMQQLEPCWIRPCALELCDAPNANEVASLRRFDCYLARLSGITTHAGDTRPIYVTEGERWAKRLTGGPAHSLLWQPPGGRLLQWHTSPSLRKGLQLGTGGDGWLRLGSASPVYLLNPPSGGDQKIRWPTTAPPGVHSFLYVNARDEGGKHLQTEWSYQGCDFQGYGYFGPTTTALSPQYVVIRQGLVTQIGGLSIPPPAGDLGTVICEVAPDDPFDPCAEPGPLRFYFVDASGFSYIDGASFEFLS